MSDTVGSLVDKLFTVDSKMWNNQEFLHQIRRMNFTQFQSGFLDRIDSKRKLFDNLQKCCNLNMQRTRLIMEIDRLLIKLVEAGLAGRDLHTPEFEIDSHKTF
ncbi:MAG TPA: hypothetical protein ENH82_08040 [bacterium]|nr:hypothetical protein [bacterium]